MAKKEITIAYIGGGSMEFGRKLISALAAEEAFCGTVQIYDTVKQFAIANEAIGNRMRELQGCRSGLIYIATETLDEALRNADFVIISIAPGEFEERLLDIAMPEEQGIYQSTGDYSGPAGIIRALRAAPQYIKIAERIRAVCPEAWVISMTSPAQVCMDALYRTFPEIKAVGCPSHLSGTQELLAELAGREFHGRTVSRRDIKHYISGIDGFSFVIEPCLDGENITPIFERYANTYIKSGYERKPNEYRTNLYASANLVKFDLFRRYGLIPAVPDRIAADFCPPWYLKSPKVAIDWKFNLTSVNFLKKRRADKLSEQQGLISGENTLPIGGTACDCPAMIKALSGLGNLITPANLPNKHQIENLPEGAIVQTSALFSKNSLKPIICGALPEDLKTLMMRHIGNYSAITRAVSEKNIDIAFNAFLNDPLMTLDIDSARNLFNSMLSYSESSLEWFI